MNYMLYIYPDTDAMYEWRKDNPRPQSDAPEFDEWLAIHQEGLWCYNITAPDGELVDGCGGFIGEASAQEAGQSTLAELAPGEAYETFYGGE